MKVSEATKAGESMVTLVLKAGTNAHVKSVARLREGLRLVNPEPWMRTTGKSVVMVAWVVGGGRVTVEVSKDINRGGATTMICKGGYKESWEGGELEDPRDTPKMPTGRN